MASRELAVTVLGRTLLSISIRNIEQPSVAERDTTGSDDAVGPVTDRRSPPILGFAGRPKDLHHRPEVM